METMIDENRLNKIKIKCGYVEGVCISSNGRSGGMGMWWKDIKVNVVSYSAHHFAIDILNDNNCAMWRAIGIYGWPEQSNKHLTWDLMSSLKSGCSIPCIMFGDFNEISSLCEKEGGPLRSERLMDAFRVTMDTCAMRDLGYRGSIYTWERGNTMDTYVRERLDRFTADEEWCALFPNFEVHNLPIIKSLSDHAPILMSSDNRGGENCGSTGFKFKSLWLSSDECGEVVAKGWSESMGLNMANRVVVCGEKLASWAALNFGSVKKRIKKG
uniref:Endonuclease/exonuclease/phosphatase domain-containing protein n=2 Tax=Chenopodium quinoa TaxID=63459 RepID=A0A803MDE4_CHEQI